MLMLSRGHENSIDIALDSQKVSILSNLIRVAMLTWET